MKILKLCLMLAVVSMVSSCFKDDTSDATRPLSHITIESGIDSVYNI